MRLSIPLDGDAGPLHRLLAEAIANEARALGATAEVTFDPELSADPETVHLALIDAPFDFSALHRCEDRDLLARTIALCTEPPGAPWFEGAAGHALKAARTLHCHPSGARELTRRGIAAEHFQLGYSTAWGNWEDDRDSRDIDMLYLGTPDARNERVRAGWANSLWRRRCLFAVPQTLSRQSAQLEAMLSEGVPGALAAAKTIAILHHAERRHLQWPLALAAIANGCVLVCERPLDTHPLLPGEHYLTGRAADLPLILAQALDEQERLRRLRQGARELVRSQMAMDDSMQRLLEMAHELAKQATGRPAQFAPRAPAPGPPPQPLPPAPAAPDQTPDLDRVLGALKRLTSETVDLRRRIDLVEHRLSSDLPPEQPISIWRTGARAAATPEVSVIVPVWNYERELAACLESVAASEDCEYELLILDDASDDKSVAVAQDFLVEHPWLPAELLRSPVNRGVSHARNALIARTRAKHVFVMDADNLIFPTALRRLLDALQDDPDASFAYPMQAAIDSSGPQAVHNLWPWDPARFVFSNYIDAMALIRREVLLEHEGYSTDCRLDSSEDHDLWCRMAERGQYGVLVPEMLGVYRIQAHSKLRTLGGVENTQTLSLIQARVPELMRRLGA
jgi:hypothetical protein